MDIAVARLTAWTKRPENGHLDTFGVFPGMTALAGYIRMFSRQLEPSPVVVESHFIPCLSRVAARTVVVRQKLCGELIAMHILVTLDTCCS